MNKLQALRSAVTTSANMRKLALEKNSPHILFGVGMVGFAATVVLASKATLSLETVLDQHEEAVAEQQVIARGNNLEEAPASALMRVYAGTGLKMAKLYGPAALVAAVSVGCLTKSHQILTQRNVALTAAYIAVDKAFKEYRKRVVDSYGEEVDRTLRHPHKVVEVKDEKGKVVAHQSVPDDSMQPSMYAKFFDETNANWNDDPALNMFFLRQQERWLNDKLMVRGHVFLNEVYDELGLDRTPAGAVVGWLRFNEDGTENNIDFGIFDAGDPTQADRLANLIAGNTEGIWLDFNVDGPIYRDI